ncbi:hypothetical protein CG723_04890 [Streptomyces sp. CB01635]|uniref:hypothetical protein n=1 Tax=Streptomyces sp. NPDC000188 TaxID=3154245 RepID=UPI000C270783|nr:hypothetical protein [Streptomyces sp. CB01635]PJN12972.1 hypothetical protein CG723_04890 [Streptomyces sp. CB01635]
MKVFRAGRGAALAGAGLVAAAAFCGYGAVSYAQARGDDALAYSRARDEVLADGRQGIATLTTLDATTAERARKGVRAWVDASTGELRTELGRTKPAAGASARGTVTEAAVTALDTRAGTAKVIATVRVSVTPKAGTPASEDRKRLEAVLARTPDGWKLKALNAVPVNGSSETSGGSDQ